MAVKEISNYSFDNIFSLSILDFEKDNLLNSPNQINTYSIYWIKKGEGTYSIDFKNYAFDDNVLLFLSPGQFFSAETQKIQEAYKLSFARDFYCIQTHDKEVACNGVLFNNVYETPFVKPCEKDTQKLSFILERLIEEFQSEDTAQYDMLQSYLKQFIVLSVRIKKEHYPVKDEIETKLFKDFSVLVEQNYKTLHSVTKYAERLGVSPKSLTKHFNKVGVETPSDFIKNRIVLEAKRKLIYSNDSVKHIGYDLGFSDSAYFTRFFKKATSKSPLQFRKDY